ncbi:hypothetical protein ACFXPZ_41245, partial [Streptomyces sp. NPDC059101]
SWYSPTTSPTDQPPTNSPGQHARISIAGEVVRELGQTVVMVTHDPVAAAHADRVVFLADGRVVDELHEPTSGAVLDRMLQFEARDQEREPERERGRERERDQNRTR